MASMRDIKRRRESIQSTSQITKAMKLVSTVKLQHAKGRAEETKPYFDKMYETVSGMLAKSQNLNHPLLKEDTIIFPVGRKGLETMQRNGYTCRGDYSEVMNNPLFGDAVSIGKTAMAAMESGEIDEIYLAYTVFKNTVTQVPTLIKMLPFSQEDIETMAANDVPETTSGALMNYEPTEEEALGYIIPMYMNSLIFGALVEAVASENGARMQAMESATSNAEEMIDTLGLQYNRARQSAITQELTEIVAGASAIE